jgi:hypothetical protein
MRNSRVGSCITAALIRGLSVVVVATCSVMVVVAITMILLPVVA